MDRFNFTVSTKIERQSKIEVLFKKSAQINQICDTNPT